MQKQDPEALINNGWFFYEKCRCQHTLKYKYRHKVHNDLEVEWWVNYAKFRITYHGSTTKIQLSDIKLLDKILKEL